MRTSWTDRGAVVADRSALKARVCDEIDRRREDLLAIGSQIWARPELGFKEYETAALVARWLRQLGIPFRDQLAITGVKGSLEGRGPGPTVAILG